MTLKIRTLDDTVTLMDEAAQCGFAVSREWIEKLDLTHGFFVQLKKDLSVSRIAINQVHNRLEDLSLHHVKKSHTCSLFEEPVISRVKSVPSILDKMWRYRNKDSGKPESYPNLWDLCGVRVTVGYLDDVYEVAEFISKSRDTCRVIEIRDNIKSPRETGYRGVHVIAKIPIKHETFIPHVEIQIRTGYQNSWSRKTHELTYKREYIPAKYQDILKEYSDILYHADQKCIELRNQIETLKKRETS